MKEHILVVDDEAPIRNLLSTFFKKRGYQVTAVETARETRAMARDQNIDLIILDIALGDDDDGLDLLTELKGEKPHLPVIILTGMGMDDDLLRESRRRGASGYIGKTMPLEELLGEVRKVLDHPGK